MVDSRKTAIYSRKSKFTGKGESIESQIDLCRTYINLNFPDVNDKDILVYEDEGYSGGNTNRPQFQKMLKECKQNNICRIVCYKLDRISRSIADFIKLTDELELHKVDFVSINEFTEFIFSLLSSIFYLLNLNVIQLLKEYVIICFTWQEMDVGSVVIHLLDIEALKQ